MKTETRQFNISKLDNSTTLVVNVHLTRQFWVRKTVASLLIKAAAIILGCRVEISTK